MIRRRFQLPKLGRDTILFVGGLAGIRHETVVHEGAERPVLLLLFATMVGLPSFLRSDEKEAQKAETPPKQEAPPS